MPLFAAEDSLFATREALFATRLPLLGAQEPLEAATMPKVRMEDGEKRCELLQKQTADRNPMGGLTTRKYRLPKTGPCKHQQGEVHVRQALAKPDHESL